jgi:hypothetical protein
VASARSLGGIARLTALRLGDALGAQPGQFDSGLRPGEVGL